MPGLYGYHRFLVTLFLLSPMISKNAIPANEHSNRKKPRFIPPRQKVHTKKFNFLLYK